MFDGVLPPVPTPFIGDRLDLASLDGNLERWMAAGLRGALVLGSNGEAPYVDEDEADTLVTAMRQRMPAGRTLMVGVGRESTRATIAATVRAADRGADAVLVRPPTTYRALMTEAALEAHFVAVADASPVPVLLYNHPLAFGVDLSTALVTRLAAHPMVRGLKESSGNVGLVGEQVAALPETFPVLTGVASTMYASLLVGATGIIVALANVVPALCVRLYDDVRNGRATEALQLQRALTPLGRAVTMQFGVPGLKAAMTLAGYVGAEPRRPMRPAGDDAVATIRALMRDVGERTGTPVLAPNET